MQEEGGVHPNHASVLYGWGTGWGEGGNTGYWLLRNTFGEKFGEQGTVKIKMGDFAINSNIAGFDVEFV